MRSLFAVSPRLGTSLLIFFFFGPYGCAGPQPVLYPNDHYKEVEEVQRQQDIAECRELADEHTSSQKGEQVAESTVTGAGVGAANGAVGGAITGSAGTGAAIGAAAGATARLIRGMFRANQPRRAYMRFVNKCLTERGYEPTGWE